MGNKSKQKDRGYITATEWKLDGGGRSNNNNNNNNDNNNRKSKSLPFDYCNLNFTPFISPGEEEQ